MNDAEMRDVVERVLWGENVLGIDMNDIIKTADKVEVSALLMMVFRAFGNHETLLVRTQIDLYLTELVKKFIAGEKI
jgi:hypothetical protein